MSETSSHKNAKTRGLSGSKTEVLIRGNRRLDASSPKIAREVERSSGEKSLSLLEQYDKNTFHIFSRK